MTNQIRKMCFVGEYTSSEWMSLAKGILFILPKYRETGFEFYCSSCNKPFCSIVTPVHCPQQWGHASDDPQAVTLTHKDYTAKTFPFFIPERA